MSDVSPDIPEDEGSPPEEPEAPEEAAAPPTIEDLLADLEQVTAQRDEYLGLAQAKQAEFETSASGS